ncbi:MAG: hypothetical protein AAGA20_11045 [Planctomycetota bacterium]
MPTKRLHALALTALAAATAPSCASYGDDINDHWNFRSVPPRVVRAIDGYDSSRDGTYGEFNARRWHEFGLTLQRHFLVYNPENPWQNPPQGVTPDLAVPEPPPNPYR